MHPRVSVCAAVRNDVRLQDSDIASGCSKCSPTALRSHGPARDLPCADIRIDMGVSLQTCVGTARLDGSRWVTLAGLDDESGGAEPLYLTTSRDRAAATRSPSSPASSDNVCGPRKLDSSTSIPANGARRVTTRAGSPATHRSECLQGWWCVVRCVDHAAVDPRCPALPQGGGRAVGPVVCWLGFAVTAEGQCVEAFDLGVGEHEFVSVTSVDERVRATLECGVA